MVCYDPNVVREALKGRLTAIQVGEYRIEYINDAGPYVGVESEHLAILERTGGVTDIIDIGGGLFTSLVEYHGAVGVPERY